MPRLWFSDTITAPSGFDFSEDTRSVDFGGAGSDERLFNSTEQTLSFGASWSLMVWLKFDAFNASQPTRVLLIDRAGDNDNEIFMFHDESQANDPFQVFLRNQFGSTYKDYDWDNLFTPGDFGTWFQILITINSSGDVLTLYKDGSSVAASTETDGTSSMTDQDRRIAVGSQAATNTDNFDGRMHSIAIWDVVLDADAATAIYNSGDGSNFNLRADSGNYTSSANLQHWWRLGFDNSEDAEIGADSGISSTLINISDNQENITVAGDVVEDAP